MGCLGQLGIQMGQEGCGQCEVFSPLIYSVCKTDVFIIRVMNWLFFCFKFRYSLFSISLEVVQAHTFTDVFLFCVADSQGEGVPLLQGEKKEIEDLLPAGTNDEDKETIFSILGQAMCRPAGIQVIEFAV